MLKISKERQAKRLKFRLNNLKYMTKIEPSDMKNVESQM
jgi:hypothetical protein